MAPSRLHPGHPTPHFPRVLKEKALSKGVVFEKESNHLSLCIIACGRDISLLGSCPPAHPPADLGCSLLSWAAGGSGGWGCSLQGASLGKRWLTEALYSLCTVTSSPHPLAGPSTFLCPPDVLPWLNKAIPSLQERSGSLLCSGGQISLPVCSAGETHNLSLPGPKRVPHLSSSSLFGIAAEVRIISFKNMFFLTMHFQQRWDFQLPLQACGFSRACNGSFFLKCPCM